MQGLIPFQDRDEPVGGARFLQSRDDFIVHLEIDSDFLCAADHIFGGQQLDEFGEVGLAERLGLRRVGGPGQSSCQQSQRESPDNDP